MKTAANIVKSSTPPPIMTVSQVWAEIKEGMTIVCSMGAAEPQAFFSSLHQEIGSRRDLRVHCANPSQDYPCFKTMSAEQVRFNVMFLTEAMRHRQQASPVAYVPQHLSQWVENLRRRPEGVDLFWGSCTPPDNRGFVSLGVGACYESEVLRFAERVILEVNPHMPSTFGTTTIHLSEIDALIENPHPLPTLSPQVSSATERAIAQHVASLVPDGATIQLGIGGIPNAMIGALEGKRDLGVHTEMINDCIMILAKKGLITGRQKSIWPGKIVGTFALGSQELYDFVHMNPMVEFQPASVVNDPYRIGRNSKMISINTAVEIDVTGQVCSESVGHLELSGVGGAADTHIGAQRSVGGRGIIAIPSTAKGDSISKIVFELRPGAKVSISRNDVDTIVTEFGIAELRGKSVAEKGSITPPLVSWEVFR